MAVLPAFCQGGQEVEGAILYSPFHMGDSQAGIICGHKMRFCRLDNMPTGSST